MSKAVFVVSSVIFLTTACVSQSAPPIMTDEKFDTRVNAEGQTEFAYGISWKNTSQESLLRNGRTEIERPKKDRQFASENQQRFAIQANNQTKMDLEDKAANALKLKLEEEQVCTNGYDISDVFWKADNIRLIGYCF